MDAPIGSFLNLAQCKSRSGKIARHFKRYTWDLLIKPIKIFNLEKMQKNRKSGISYLYYISLRARKSFRRGGRYGHARGTVGSGLTPGSPLGRRTLEIPEISGKNPENPENCMWHIKWKLLAHWFSWTHWNCRILANPGKISRKTEKNPEKKQ